MNCKELFSNKTLQTQITNNAGIYIFKNIWNFDIEDISNSIQLYTSDIMCYNSYEEAEIACLIKLIEITKEQNVK